MKNKNTILIILGLLAYYYLVKDKLKAGFSLSLGDTQPSTPEGFTGAAVIETKVLKYGSQGEEVKELQRILNEAKTDFSLAYNPLEISGNFGTETATALMLAANQRQTKLRTINSEINLYQSTISIPYQSDGKVPEGAEETFIQLPGQASGNRPPSPRI